MAIGLGYLINNNPGQGRRASLVLGDRPMPTGQALPEPAVLAEATSRGARTTSPVEIRPQVSPWTAGRDRSFVSEGPPGRRHRSPSPPRLSHPEPHVGQVDATLRGLDTKGLVATGRWKDRKSADRYEHVVVSEEVEKVQLLPAPVGKIRGNEGPGGNS